MDSATSNSRVNMDVKTKNERLEEFEYNMKNMLRCQKDDTMVQLFIKARVP